MNATRQILAGAAAGAVLSATVLYLQSSEQSRLTSDLTKLEQAQSGKGPRTIRDAAKELAEKKAAETKMIVEEEKVDPGPLTPDEIISRLATLENAQDPIRAMLQMMSALQHLPADRIPDAMKAVKGWKKPFLNMGMGPVLYARWAELDPKAAMESAGKNDMDMPLLPFFGGDAGQAKMGLKMGAFAGWMGRDPAAAMEWMKTEKPFGDRRGGDGEEAAMGMAMLMAGDKSRSQAIVDTMPADKRLALMAKTGLLDTDTPEAMDKALAQATSPEARKALMREGIDNMARNDPKATMAWLAKQPEDERNASIGSAFGTWAQDDPDAALDWYAAQPEDGRKNVDPGGLAWRVGDRSPDELRALAAKIPDEKEKTEFMANSVRMRTWNEPEEAAGMIKDIPDPAKQSELAEDTARRWGQQQDTSKPVAWIQSQPDGPVKDNAIKGFADSAWSTHNDGMAAAEWLGTMTDETQRTAALTEHTSKWMKKEPEAATEWLKGTQTLTEEQKAGILAAPASPVEELKEAVEVIGN